jgi:hypothetical protein
MRMLLASMVSLLVLAAAAIEPAQSPPGTPPGAEPAKQPPPPVPAPKEDTAPAQDAKPDGEEEAPEEELPPLPPDVDPVGPSPQRFNPTEKVRADFPVSFPIDI